MDILQFLAAIVAAIAWPATAITLVVLLRRPVSQILTTLTKLKYKDLELDFGRELKQLEKQAKAIEVVPSQVRAVGGPKDPQELLSEAERLVEEFPEPAVAVAWSAVEDHLAQAAERLSGSTSHRRQPPSRVIRSLLEGEAIDQQTVDLLKRMQNLRNAALHERWNAFGGISPDEAREFIALARGVNEKLECIGRRRP
jgi:uncharacterized protein YutE (UPF0331/DUF86 family)